MKWEPINRWLTVSVSQLRGFLALCKWDCQNSLRPRSALTGAVQRHETREGSLDFFEAEKEISRSNPAGVEWVVTKTTIAGLNEAAPTSTSIQTREHLRCCPVISVRGLRSSD